MTRILLCLFTLLAIAVGALADAIFYVAPTGSDANPGTKDKPFATIARARDAIRPLPKTHNITVMLRGGTYFLQEPLMFGTEDSRTDTICITYQAFPGETPVISGGQRITGWQKAPANFPGLPAAAQGKVWLAHIPAGWRFHTFSINGAYQPRAVQPNSNDWRQWPRLAGAGPLNKNTQELTFTAPYVPANENAEISLFPRFRHRNEVVALTTVNPAQRTAVRAAAVSGYAAGTGDPYRLENTLAALDRPGEWCVDAVAGVVYCWSPNGTMANVTAVGGKLPVLIRVEGADADHPVRGLGFFGLTFTDSERITEAEWPEAWSKVQLASNPQAAVQLRNVENCLITDCRFLNLAAAGLSVEGKGTGVKIFRNEFGFLGGTAIRLQGNPPDKPVGARPGHAHTVTGCQVTRNYVHDAGLAYYRSPGIELLEADGNLVSWNVLLRLPFAGIRLQGGLRHELTRNHLGENVITDVLQNLAGNGAISCNYCGDGTLVRANLIRYSDPAKTGYNVYFDWVIGGAFTGNVSWMTSPKPQVYKGTNNTNFLLSCTPNLRERGVDVSREDAEKYIAAVPFTWEDNIISAARPAAYDLLLKQILANVTRDGGWPAAVPAMTPQIPAPAPPVPDRWLTGPDCTETQGLNIEAGDLLSSWAGKNAWVSFGPYDFTGRHIAAVDIFIRTKHADWANRTVEVRLDRFDGTLLGTLAIACTGDTPRLYRTRLPNLTGIHRIYLAIPEPVDEIIKLRFAPT